jgi:hypothetical protein
MRYGNFSGLGSHACAIQSILYLKSAHSTLMSVSDPGAKTNWLSLPSIDLMKVWDSVISISPELLTSNLAQVLGKNSET